MRTFGLTHRTVVLLGTALLVSACSGGVTGDGQSVLTSLGLRQTAPDEFMVVERKPLVMPPSFSALPSPQPGMPNRVDPRPQQETIVALTGQASTGEADLMSDGQRALLTAAGTEGIDPNIRDVMSQENAAATAPRSYGIRRIFGRATEDPYSNDALDPTEEMQRQRAQGAQTPAAPEEVEANETDENAPRRGSLSVRLF
ncbi:MAG: DUF3035 domain-containing protein [Pseudomonadota bacterium]